MIQHLSWSITNLFIRQNEISDEDGEIYAFGFECILATTIQIIILFIVGLIFNCLIEIGVYTLFFTRIKGYIGGYHANTHFTCISGFTIVALLSVFLCKALPYWASFIFAFIGLLLVLLFAPIQHLNNPKTKNEMVEARKKAIIVAVILVAIIYTLWFTPVCKYVLFGAIGFFTATISLIIPNKYYS